MTKDLEKQLQEELGCSAVFARLLVSRGFSDVESVQNFLTPSLERDWLDPELLSGMGEVVARLELALDRGERICVFGDFDLDGLSATALMVRALRALGAAELSYLIPRRFGDGYGLSDATVEQLLTRKPDLVVTVDNGISADLEVATLLDAGIDVVITDHHEPGAHQPHGVPVIDPKLDPAYGLSSPSSSGVISELSGAGVALKVIQALGRRRAMPQLWLDYLDLATLGTIADVMPLLGENRALIAAGLEQIRTQSNIGLVALAQMIPSLDLSTLSAERIAYTLAPRLNAPGRVGEAVESLELLLAEDAETAQGLAETLIRRNTERQELERELEAAATAQAEQTYRGERALILAGDGWHEGVRGIVASRLVDRYGVVTIIGSITDGMISASARGIGQVDLFQAFSSCADCFDHFGGHPAAAGLTFPLVRLDEFKARLLDYLDALPPEAFERRKEADISVALAELDYALTEEFARLEPCGHANPLPVLKASPVELVGASVVGAAGEHLRFVARQRDARLPAIWFRAIDAQAWLGQDRQAELLFRLEKDTYRGRRGVQLQIKDIHELDDEFFRGQFDELRRALIGSAPLHRAQEQSLEALAAGENTLTVMATGRGKSLIFHLHAALCALRFQQPSLFIYPLRALVADQAYFLEKSLARLGLVAAVLTGETSLEQREAIYSGLIAGKVNIILTTPEYLHFHADALAAAARFAFVVVDEAHHIGQSHAGNRPAYAQLGAAIEKLGGLTGCAPTTLAVTATAGPEIAARICETLRITRTVSDDYSRDNLYLVDKRGAGQDAKQDYLLTLIEEKVLGKGGKLVVYVNSRAESVRLTRLIRKALPDIAAASVFYNGKLDRPTRAQIQQGFRDGDLRIVIATSAFGEGVNVSDIRDVVLYHLPYSDVEFNQMSGRAGRDGEPAYIHLLFGEEDAAINRHILAPLAPSRESLVALYQVLRDVAAGEGGSFTITAKDLTELCNNYLKNSDRECGPEMPQLSEEAAVTGLAVFRELGFITWSAREDEHSITFRPSSQKVDLQSSVRYLEGQSEQEDFEQFCEWVLSASTESLRSQIIHPLLPA